MADHCFCYQGPDVVRGQLSCLSALIAHANRETSGQFKLVREIANAYKHLYLDKYEPEISSAGAVYSISISGDTSDLTEIVAVPYVDRQSHEVVRFKMKDGQEKDFKPVLDAVIQFWDRFLQTGDRLER